MLLANIFGTNISDSDLSKWQYPERQTDGIVLPVISIK